MIDTPDLALRNQILGIAGSSLESVGEAHHILDILLLSRLGQLAQMLHASFRWCIRKISLANANTVLSSSLTKSAISTDVTT